MGARLLFLAVLITLFSSFAFAGPQVVVSDPLCTHSDPEVSLSSGNYAFVYDGTTAKITFCNDTSSTFTSLNFTITSPTAFNLGGFYCGAPNSYATAAFDSCMVLDPRTAAPSGQNSQLYYGNILQPNELVVHQFVTSYPVFLPLLHDTPNSFYQTDSCRYGCGTVITNLGNEVHLSFDLLTPLNLRPEICSDPNVANLLTNVPCGLLPNHQFTLTFECDAGNTAAGIPIPCSSLPEGSGISFLASTSPDQVNFPAVPEPTTLALVAGAGIPALLRRRKKA